MPYLKLLGIYLRGILSHFIIVHLWPARHLDKAMLLWCWAWEYAEWEAICQFEGERYRAKGIKS